MVAVRCARLPGGRGAGEGGGHPIEVEPEVLVVEHLLVAREVDDPRGVGEDLPDGDVLLAERAELGPERPDRAVDVEQSLVGEHLGDERCGPLRRGEDRCHRVGRPRLPRSCLTGPQVSDEMAIDEDRRRGSYVSPVVEILGERVTKSVEAR